jgi:SAM-dependent methyltransferase
MRQSPWGTYAWPNAWEQARRRLELLEQCHDPTSFRYAAARGIGDGWRCLDAGAGSGSFTRWLGEKVGTDGRVVAADLDVRLLEDIAAPNIEVRQMDVSDELPQAAFNFVYTRLVLLHIPARDEVLRKLFEALRPGGVLMVEEHDSFPVLATATGAYRDAWQPFLAMSRAAGIDDRWARELPARLAALGMVDVDAELDVPFFRGCSAHAEFWNLTWEQARERIVAMGESDEHIDRGQAELADDQRWFYEPAMVIAWGRRPD